MRPDEAQKVLSILRERGSYTVIDRITAKLNIKEDRYEAEFSNLGVKEILLAPSHVSESVEAALRRYMVHRSA